VDSPGYRLDGLAGRRQVMALQGADGRGGTFVCATRGRLETAPIEKNPLGIYSISSKLNSGGDENAASGSCICAGRRKGNAPLSSYQRARQAGGSLRGQIPDSRFRLEQFDQLGNFLDLRADPVQEPILAAALAGKTTSLFRFPRKCVQPRRIGIAAPPTPFFRT
jgi:hypothetical protein